METTEGTAQRITPLTRRAVRDFDRVLNAAQTLGFDHIARAASELQRFIQRRFDNGEFWDCELEIIEIKVDALTADLIDTQDETAREIATELNGATDRIM